MIEVTCSYCGKIYSVQTTDQLPEICENCNSPLSEAQINPQQHSPISEIIPQTRPSEIILTYQKTGEKICLKISDKLILGREHLGREIFQNIPQISRRHCSIELEDNNLIVNDLGSKNGTFVGLEKIDCKLHPRQILKDGDFLQLGREIFLVKIKYEEPQPAAQSQGQPGNLQSPESEKPRVVKYRCKSCGNVFDEKFDICPFDNAYGTMEEVFEE